MIIEDCRAVKVYWEVCTSDSTIVPSASSSSSGNNNKKKKKKKKKKKNHTEMCNLRFYTVSSLCGKLSPTCMHMCANHVWHTERSSHATLGVPCSTKGQLSC